MKYFTLFNIVVLFLFNNIRAQDSLKYKLDDVLVSAGRMPVSINNSARIVTVIRQSELASIPVNTVQDILQYIGGLDLKQRGTEGVQADMSIRGSTFEQSLIMIDGVKIIDPQTGHHNLNLPITSSDIQRIEIVKGQASKSFGPNAFGGVVNIITRKYGEDSISIEAGGGQNSYYNSALSGIYNFAGLNSKITFSQTGSDGYRHNTEFKSTSFNYSSSYSIPSGNLNLLFGFNEKDFGANSFYSLAFPDQAEHTITKLVNFSANLGSEKFFVYPKFYWRRNDDEFVLDKNNPGFYKNLHETNVYGAEVQSTLLTDYGLTSFGFEYNADQIESTNLGQHSRDKMGVFFEHASQVTNKLNINLGGFIYKYADHKWQFWPGIDASYSFTESFKSFLSVGKAFRIPTYTELYYNDPVTVGSADLKQEEAVSYELGLTVDKHTIAARVFVFRREGKNIIDWVRINDDKPWTVRNIAEVNTNGFEIEFRFNPKEFSNLNLFNNLFINYTFLDSDKKTETFDSRYVLDHLKHQVIAGLNHSFMFGIKTGWYFRYEDRLNYEDSFITDLQLSKSIAGFELTLKATNIFNKTYRDIAGVTLPGRWVKGSIRYQLDL